MTHQPDDRITLLGLLISFSLLGVIALLGISIWQGRETLEFLEDIFRFEGIDVDVLIGLLIGIAAVIFVVLLVKITKTKLPRNKYTQLLKDLMLRPYGPLVVGVLPGIFEEMLFRGFLLPLAMSLIGTTWGIIIVSLIFCALHVPQYRNNWVVNFHVLLLAIALSYSFVWTGALWAPMLAHTVYNYLVSVLTLRGIINLE